MFADEVVFTVLQLDIQSSWYIINDVCPRKNEAAGCNVHTNLGERWKEEGKQRKNVSCDKTFNDKTPGHAWPDSLYSQGSTEVPELVNLYAAEHECASSEQPIVDIDSVTSAALCTLLTIQKT